MGDIRNAYTILTIKPERKRRHRCRWENNIKMDAKQIG
jgi:hypothetical protein